MRGKKKKKKLYKKKKKYSHASKILSLVLRTAQSRVFGLILKSLAAVAIVVVFFTSIFVAYCITDLPDIEKLSEDSSRPHITVRDQSGQILSHYGDIYGNALTYGQIPKHLIEAVVATEDRRFFDHSGIDYWGILRAAYKNQVAGKVVQGGSTITQQLAKIVFLSADRTMKRKVQEALLSIQLERIFSKEQIITIYLNRVFLGHANYGIDAAARNYFGKRAENLLLYESAFIAGMLKAPTRYAPPGGTALALNRAKQVLYNMADAGFISESQVKTTPLPTFINKARPRGILQNPYFADYVLSELPSIIPNVKQSLDIYTTFDLTAQQHLEDAVHTVLAKTKVSKKAQVAAIAINSDGAIQAMIGGKAYTDSQFNRATEAKRQPGSLFKLFVYLAALENGYSVNQRLLDEPIKVGKWQPRNFSRTYRGSISMQEAFAYSVNSITVKLSEAIGRNKVISMAHRLGISDALPSTPSVALGTGATTLIDLVFAYATIANNGKLVQDSSIRNIVNSANNSLYRHRNNTIFDHRRILDHHVLEQIKKMLSASVLYGTSKAAFVPGYQIYGKTGTTQNHRDAWFIGIVNNTVVGVWIGNDDDSPMEKVTGGSIPALIFKEYIVKSNFA